MSELRNGRSARAIEVLSVVLLAVATVGSAWCAYQSTRWNGEEATQAQHSTDERVEATRLFSYGAQVVSYDAGVAADYAKAYLAGDQDLQAFYRNVLARPEFVTVLDDWQERADSGAELGSLLTDEEYIARQLTGYQEAMDASDAAGELAREAGTTADEYIVLTLLLAGALFFAGVTSSFRTRTVQLALLTLASVLIALTAGQLANLPIA